VTDFAGWPTCAIALRTTATKEGEQ
jgi:hypothetical protein